MRVCLGTAVLKDRLLAPELYSSQDAELQPLNCSVDGHLQEEEEEGGDDFEDFDAEVAGSSKDVKPKVGRKREYKHSTARKALTDTWSEEVDATTEQGRMRGYLTGCLNLSSYLPNCWLLVLFHKTQVPTILVMLHNLCSTPAVSRIKMKGAARTQALEKQRT